MSIQTQIDRLQDAKSSIKSAITGKGVAVPESASLSEYAALIESIESGSAESHILESGECGDTVYWVLDVNGILYVYGEGATYDYNNSLNAPFRNNSGFIKRIIVEEGVTYLGKNLFYISQNCESAIIADSVTSIASSAFELCYALKDVYIGSGISEIANYTFEDSSELENVFYNGTKANWNSITKNVDAQWPLMTATLHCAENDTVDGWHIEVKDDGSAPTGITKPTLTFVYTVGG